MKLLVYNYFRDRFRENLGTIFREKNKMEKEKKGTIDLGKLAQNVQKWVTSAEGKKAIQTVLRSSEEMTTELKEARDIDPKSFHDPFTL